MALNVQQPHNIFAPQKQAYQSNAYMDNDPRVAGQATVTPTQPVQQNVAQQQGTANNMVTNGGLAGTGTYSGGPNNGQAALEYLDSLYTSPQEEDKLRKASVANQRILAVGDALRHIFNIHNTVKGAPAQQLNSPVMEEYGRYEKGKALRDAANARYYTYQQQKAAQDAAAKRWQAEQERQANQWNATFNFNAQKAAADLAERQRQADQTYRLNVRKADDAKEKAEADRKLKDAISRRSNSLGWANHNLSKQKFEYQKKNGGGRKLPEILRGKKGFYSKQMTANELKSFYNQTYDEMKNRGLIDEKGILAGIEAGPWNVKKITDTEKRDAVDKLLMQHPEVGDWLENEFEFDFDPRDYEEDPGLFKRVTNSINSKISNARQQGNQQNVSVGKSLGIGLGKQSTQSSGRKLGIGL